MCDPDIPFDTTELRFASVKGTSKKARSKAKSKSKTKGGPPEGLPNRGKICWTTHDRLHQWRCEIYERNHEGAMYCYDAILPDNLMDTLSSYGPLTHQHLRYLLKKRWIWWDRYGEELGQFMASLDIEYVPLTPLRPDSVLADPLVETMGLFSEEVSGQDRCLEVDLFQGPDYFEHLLRCTKPFHKAIVLSPVIGIRRK